MQTKLERVEVGEVELRPFQKEGFHVESKLGLSRFYIVSFDRVCVELFIIIKISTLFIFLSRF